MKPINPWLLLALLLTLLVGALGWVGWYFFYPSPPKEPRPEAQRTPWFPWLKWPQFRLALGRPQWPLRFRELFGSLRGWRWLWLLSPVLLVAFTVFCIFSFAKRTEIDPLQCHELAAEGQVSLRLHQEKLVPPPPMPPSVFIGTERPNLETADRDWVHLNADFTQTVLALFARMAKRGYPMVLLEGYRSPERQDMLAGKGPHVTNARAYQSKHQYGIAVDLAPIRDDRLVISERDPWAMAAYQALGEEAAASGLTWGGHWAMRDLGHIEMAGKIPDSVRRISSLR